MCRAIYALGARGQALFGAVLMGVPGAWQPAQAASASAEARVSVVAAVSVPDLLGSPISVNDVLLALQSTAAGPSTGSRLMRLVSAFPPPDPPALSFNDPGVSSAMAGALGAPDSAGTLEGDRAASVSLRPSTGETPASITVAFN